MSTRKLIITALLCGVAILVAGMLFLLGTNKQPNVSPGDLPTTTTSVTLVR